ncbi:putative secreted protein (Por secretion system target) [Winogradskyella pacifica]|uniref:Putative secreted protein (Por secretion system target) n=1 Tax=Winogradskyella pacifica TaxID=664642 RepID=A0A3D9N6Y0_9FLAO|nr:FG-GAP-like repeat-containing protein [Winogradskyella pacifica]REE27933.1 putative secreted protein (Por secretion system target) [Winogradskyella pacifica]
MKKTLLITLVLTLFCAHSYGQELNKFANWPNNQWVLSGTYDAAYLDADPTTTSASFSFNDDEAGGASDNTIAAESPIIDLTNAFNANEIEIKVEFAYVYNIYQNDQSLFLQYWDNSTSQWVNWGTEILPNSSTQGNFCNASSTNYSSELLDISGFSNTQLTGFKYRMLYDDNDSFGWGFCIDSPTISSSALLPCPNVSSISLSNINTVSAMASWTAGGSETSWEVVIQLATDGVPTSGTTSAITNYSFTNLSPGTAYRIYIRANCVADGYSYWETVSFTTGTNNTGDPVSFTTNPINTIGVYDIALVDLNGDFLDDVVSVSTNSLNIHYQVASGGFNMTNIPTPGVTSGPNWSLAAGDFDRNGYNDLLYGGGARVTFLQANNTGTGYSPISGSEYVFSQRSNFVDINNDGHLDAFVCHDVDPNVYYINDGSGNLTFHQGQSAVLPNGIGLVPGGGNYGTVWIDFDNDRDMDLFIAKCRGGSSISINELWRNDGNGVFVNIADSNGWYDTNYPSVGHDNSSNLGDLVQTWSSAWADFDNDGDMDVYVGASSTSDGYSKLMQNNGDGTFTDVTAGSGVLSATMGIENAPADFDNDGYVDILSNGDILFNNGDFTFTNHSSNMPPSGAIGDVNNDGFLDVFRNGNIYLNNTNANNWIKINTVGTISNINGIGARVEIQTSNGTQIRDVRSGEGFEYMSSLNTHFGIGNSTSINNITIYWPSGTVDFISNPAINTAHTIVEGSALTVIDETLVDVSIYPNPVEAELTIKTSANVINKIATVFDINGKRILSQKLDSNTINVSNLTSGIYFLRLESEGKIIKRKFIKK